MESGHQISIGTLNSEILFSSLIIMSMFIILFKLYFKTMCLKQVLINSMKFRQMLLLTKSFTNRWNIEIYYFKLMACKKMYL
jgi:hypothetical protein